MEENEMITRMELLEQIKMLKRSNKNYKENFRHRSNKKFTKLKNELQAYKDREDKLRDKINVWIKVASPELCKSLLQILNKEGR